MRKKEIFLTIDTETCPMDKDFEGVSAHNMLPYEIGVVVHDRQGNEIGRFSFIIKEVFEDEKDLMKSAYYAKKIPEYEEDIANGVRILANWCDIYKFLINIINENSVKRVMAHNARFDYVALNNLVRWLSKSKYRYCLPSNITWCDTLKMARQIIAPMPTYQKFCNDNGYLTKNGKVKLTAEVLYRFISKDNSFVEEHKGMDDALIEKEIMAYCFRQHKKVSPELWVKA